MIQLYPDNKNDLKGLLKNIDRNELVIIRDIQDIKIKTSITKMFHLLRIMPQGAGYKKTYLTPSLKKCFKDLFKSDKSDRKKPRSRSTSPLKNQNCEAAESIVSNNMSMNALASSSKSKIGPERPTPEILASSKALAVVDDVDEVGPALPTTNPVLFPLPDYAIRTVNGKAVSDSGSKKRDEWMTVPKGKGEHDANWTESQEEKIKREFNEEKRREYEEMVKQVLGKRGRDGIDSTEVIQVEKIEDVKPKSLMELHNERLIAEAKARTKLSKLDSRYVDEKDPNKLNSKLAHFDPTLLAPSFDRDKDFNMGSLKNLDRRSDMDASELKERFASAGKMTKFV